jgi:hypothetical protein
MNCVCCWCIDLLFNYIFYMSFENQIQQWVSIDNQLRIANERVYELREKRANITNELLAKNALNHNKIPISDGHLKIVNTRTSEPLTFTYLEKSLKEIIKNETQVKIILEHIKSSRATRSNVEIKRFIN